MSELPYGPGPHAREKFISYYEGQITTAQAIIAHAESKLGELATAESPVEPVSPIVERKPV